MSYVSTYDGVVHMTCAETAKLVRAALKKAFPGVKFSVRSDTYSGGASIRVGWTDGPKGKAVDGVVGVFAGGGFDGMIDLKYHKDHWLMPDGSVQVAHNRGTEGSRGSVPEYMTDPPSPDAQLVSFSADYVFTTRDMSPEVEARLVEEVEAYTGKPFDAHDDLGVSAFHDDGCGGSSLARGGSCPRTYGSVILVSLFEGRDYTVPCACPPDSHYPAGGTKRCALCGKEAK